MSDDIERIVPPELMEVRAPRVVDTGPPLSLEGLDTRVIDIFQDEPIEMLLGMMPVIQEMLREDDEYRNR